MDRRSRLSHTASRKAAAERKGRLGRMLYRVKFFEAQGDDERVAHWRGQLRYAEREAGVRAELPPGAPTPTQAQIERWDREDELEHTRAHRRGTAERIERNAGMDPELRRNCGIPPPETEHAYLAVVDASIASQAVFLAGHNHARRRSCSRRSRDSHPRQRGSRRGRSRATRAGPGGGDDPPDEPDLAGGAR